MGISVISNRTCAGFIISAHVSWLNVNESIFVGHALVCIGLKLVLTLSARLARRPFNLCKNEK